MNLRSKELMQLRGINATSRTADFIASTDAIDSYDEVVEQSWNLTRYKANPIVLYAHQSRELPIGRATRCEVVKGALECTILFAASDANPKAGQVWSLIQSKMLRAVSVGFAPGETRKEVRDGRDVWVLAKNELYEISVVPIPANPEALSKFKALRLQSDVDPVKEVDALIKDGIITPGERDGYIELAATDRTLFAEFVANRKLQQGDDGANLFAEIAARALRTGDDRPLTLILHPQPTTRGSSVGGSELLQHIQDALRAKHQGH